MTNTIDIYYQIIGLSENATVEEIKRAYRQRAKDLHPDKNKRDDAHEQFILLTEAYDCLINLKTGGAKAKQPAFTYAQWQAQSREQARQRARQYAQMQYEAFKKTDYYKKTVAASIILEHFYFFSSILLLFLPVLGYFILGFDGMVAGLALTFVTVRYWADIFKERTNINFRSLYHSVALIAKTKTFKIIGITLINAFLFFRFTLNTQITVLLLFLIFAGLFLLTYLAYLAKSPIVKMYSKTTVLLCLLPGLFNLFFLINFLFSTNRTIEKYSFVHKEEWYGGLYSEQRLEKTSYIILENNAYNDYQWFRMFFNFDAMKDKSEITYIFEDGFFGLRVLKSYKFTN